MKKMITTLGDPVNYSISLGDQQYEITSKIGEPIALQYHGEIHCIHCDRLTKKSFSQGYCYPCFRRLAQCDICIMSPEKCHFDEGTCREPEWGETFCMQDHFVYLANSSGTKIGITRQDQLPTRWIDQGAMEALPIFRVQSRKISGLVEVAFKAHIADKTNWQRMLKGEPESVDLVALRDQLMVQVAPELAEITAKYGDLAMTALPDAEQLQINFPVSQYPTKVKSLNFDKQPLVEGTLLGIKGQYLILDIGVINLRKFTGYDIELLTA